MAVYSKTSPYFQTSVTGQYLSTWTPIDIPANTFDILWTITPTYDNRPDLLAFDLYGDVNLWWVFAVRNPEVIVDSVYDFVAGTTIYLPQQATLNKLLGI
jgi:hypothetical protein